MERVLFLKNRILSLFLGNIPLFWKMSKVVFRNFDIPSIKKLLKEIGQERYEAALADNKIIQKPLTMKGFFVEFEVGTHDINLYHRYPSGAILYIMPVLGYWAVPFSGWELHRKKESDK